MRGASSISTIWLTALLIGQPSGARAAAQDVPASPKSLARLSAQIGRSYRKILDNLEDQIQGRSFPQPISLLQRESERLDGLIPRYFAMRRDLGIPEPERLDLSSADERYLDEARGRIQRLRYGREEEGIVAQVDGVEGEFASWQVQGLFVDGSESDSTSAAQARAPEIEVASRQLQGVSLMEEVLDRASGVRPQYTVSGMGDQDARMCAADFDALDKNGDGFLDQEELAGDGAFRKLLRGRLAALGADHDARLQRSELIAWNYGVIAGRGGKN